MFKTYFKGLSPEQKISLALRCKTTLGQLRQVACGARPAGESLAINIERETHGAVTCESLRPDVDWAYLRGTSKAA